MTLFFRFFGNFRERQRGRVSTSPACESLTTEAQRITTRIQEMGSFTSDLNAARSGNIDWLASLRSDANRPHPLYPCRHPSHLERGSPQCALPVSPHIALPPELARRGVPTCRLIFPKFPEDLFFCRASLLAAQRSVRSAQSAQSVFPRARKLTTALASC